jgi:hypothetical protein
VHAELLEAARSEPVSRAELDVLLVKCADDGARSHLVDWIALVPAAVLVGTDGVSAAIDLVRVCFKRGESARDKRRCQSFGVCGEVAHRAEATEALTKECPRSPARELVSDELAIFDDGVGAKESEEVGLSMCVTARCHGLCVKRRAAAGPALVEEQDPELLASPAEPARRVIWARRREAGAALQEDEPWELFLVLGGEDDLACEDGEVLTCGVRVV